MQSGLSKLLLRRQRNLCTAAARWLLLKTRAPPPPAPSFASPNPASGRCTCCRCRRGIISHKEIQRPNIRKKATTKIDVGPNSMPANLQKIIHDMAGEIMLSRNKFKQRLIQETGGSTKYAGGKKAIKENLISTEEKLRVDAFWLEPICRVIFSRPLDGFTRYKVGDVDSLIKEIIESHIQSLRE